MNLRMARRGLILACVVALACAGEDEDLIDSMFGSPQTDLAYKEETKMWRNREEGDGDNPLWHWTKLLRPILQGMTECKTMSTCQQQMNKCIESYKHDKSRYWNYKGNIYDSNCMILMAVRLDQLDYVQSGRSTNDKLTQLIPTLEVEEHFGRTAGGWQPFFDSEIFSEISTPFDQLTWPRGRDKIGEFHFNDLKEKNFAVPMEELSKATKHFNVFGICVSRPDGPPTKPWMCIFALLHILRSVGHDAPRSGFIIWMALAQYFTTIQAFPYAAAQCFRKAYHIARIKAQDDYPSDLKKFHSSTAEAHFQFGVMLRLVDPPYGKYRLAALQAIHPIRHEELSVKMIAPCHALGPDECAPTALYQFCKYLLPTTQMERNTAAQKRATGKRYTKREFTPFRLSGKKYSEMIPLYDECYDVAVDMWGVVAAKQRIRVNCVKTLQDADKLLLEGGHYKTIHDPHPYAWVWDIATGIVLPLVVIGIMLQFMGIIPGGWVKAKKGPRKPIVKKKKL